MSRSRSRDRPKKGSTKTSEVRDRRPRNHHRRRRDDEEDEDAGGFGGWKLGLVIGVIVMCFAVVYPHVFHPLLMSFMGRSDPVPQATSRPPMHPGMGGRAPTGSSRGPAGHHPSMGHPSFGQGQVPAADAGSKGGARSLYTFMIPIYTVGVIAFLLYTMFKSKKKNRRNRRRGSDDEYSDDEDEEESRGRGKPLGGRKMRDLQERLKQTESAMSKILEQLEKAQAEGKLTPEMMANLGEQASKVEEEQPKPASKGKKASKKDKEAAKGDKTLENVAKQLPDQETTQYMEDLEKALADFKELSDLYEDAQGGKRRRQASESESDGSVTDEDVSSDAEDDDDGEEEREGEDREEKHSKMSSKASSSHPFPEADDDSEVEIEEVEQDDDDDEEQDQDEEPAREPTPPPPAPEAADEKIRRRKPKKI